MSEEKQEQTILDEQLEKQLGYLAGLLETTECKVQEVLEDDDKHCIYGAIQEAFFDYFPELKDYLEKISKKYVTGEENE